MKLTIPFLPRNSSFDFLHKNYRIIEYVGKGQFGNTYKVENIIDNKIWLAKCIDLSQMDEDDKKRSLQEAEIMKSINHPHVIKCHESFMHDDVYLVIIMEYCERGDIGSVIDSCISKKTYLPEKTILYWCVQLAAGLHYLHNECRIIHRDIKPSNIFIRENGDIVIGDFGISRIMLSVTMPFTLTSIGTPQYMSPEMCENKPYTYKSDIWSFGCVLYELTCLKPPFSGDSLLSLAWKISFQEIEPLPSCYSINLFKLIQRLLSRDPILRPGLIEILNELIHEYEGLTDFLPNQVTENKREKSQVIFNIQSEECKNLPERKLSDEKNTIQLDTKPSSDSSIENKDLNISIQEKSTLIEAVNEQNNRNIGLSDQFNFPNNGFDRNEGIINSIPTFLSSNDLSKCYPAENYILVGEKTQDYCDILTNYEHQYFSVIVGRIQHHILRYFEKSNSELFSEQEDLVTILIKSFKSCQNNLFSLDGYLTPEWFSEFVNELGVGLSEYEVSFFLSCFGHLIHSKDDENFSESTNDFKKHKSSYKIRHTKSSSNLLSLGVSKTMRNIDSKANKFIFGTYGLNESSSIQSKENIKLPKIYDFIEKIFTLNHQSSNNKLHLKGNFESSKSKYTYLWFQKESNFFPVSPIMNYENTKQNINSIQPCFYLFITDWIKNILIPIIALINTNYNLDKPSRKLNKITLSQGFRLFDQKAQGNLSRQHFRTVLYLILPKLTSVQLDWLYSVAPKDFAGNVKYKQFMEFITSFQKSGKNGTCDKNTNNKIQALDDFHRVKSENQTKNSNYIEKSKSIYLQEQPNFQNSAKSEQSDLQEVKINTNILLNKPQTQNDETQMSSKVTNMNEEESYLSIIPIKNEILKKDEQFETNSNGYDDLPIMQQELYGFGIQDVVLLHYNNQACLRRPSPSPQLLARARSTSFIRTSIKSYETQVQGQNKENDNQINTDITGMKVNQKLQKFQRHTSLDLKHNSEKQNFKISQNQEHEDRMKELDLDSINDENKSYNLLLQISKNIIENLSMKLESLIQKLQVERIYTCWITAKASESQQEELFSQVFEKLTSIRLSTSLSLDLLISNLQEMKNFDQFDSVVELDNILLILKEELPLQRDAIDCILRVIDHMELSTGKEAKRIKEQNHGILLTDQFNTKNQFNSNTTKVYKEIMKQAITNNIVLPISTKGKYKSCRSYEGDLISSPLHLNNNLEESTDFSELQLTSKVFDWTGKFLASFEFFGEATINLIQCGINILENIRNFKQDAQFVEKNLKDFSQLNFLIENYRQWSHLKEHVSRECAFVASIGANYDLKNDIETARIFLELLGARRFQVSVTWQQQSSTEQQLFKKLFLLEECLWNNQKYYLREDTIISTRKSDSELWLIYGEQTCGALHNTCNKFVSEIQSLL